MKKYDIILLAVIITVLLPLAIVLLNFNTVEVKDGKVRVLEADCPNKDCVNKGYINKNNESVICLPHRFEVIVKSSDEDYDIIVQ